MAPPDAGAAGGEAEAQLSREQQVGFIPAPPVHQGAAAASINRLSGACCLSRPHDCAHPQAVKDAALAGRNIMLTGCAGTGKSFWIKHMLAHWEREGKEVRRVAATAAAAGAGAVWVLRAVAVTCTPINAGPASRGSPARRPSSTRVSGGAGRPDRVCSGADWRAHAALMPPAGRRHQGACCVAFPASAAPGCARAGQRAALPPLHCWVQGVGLFDLEMQCQLGGRLCWASLESCNCSRSLDRLLPPWWRVGATDVLPPPAGAGGRRGQCEEEFEAAGEAGLPGCAGLR